MSTQYQIGTRLIVLFFTLLSLAVAILNSANARFSIILRNRARSDYIDTTDGILNNNFQKLQSNILIATVLTAFATAIFTIYGVVIAVHPRWIREYKLTLYAFTTTQIALALIMIGTGAYLADHVHRFDTSFEKFSTHDSIPYYSIMYHGGIAEAAYGSFLVFLIITVSVFDHYQTKQSQDEAIEQAVPNNNDMEVSQV